MNTREAIFAALFTRVSAAAGFVTSSRTLRHWNDVKPGEQAALFQMEGRQSAVSAYRTPTKWKLHAEIYLYVHQATSGQADVVVALNTLVDAVMTALAPDYESVQTLGGIVADCRVQGEIETSEGRLGPQAVAIIPLELIPNI